MDKGLKIRLYGRAFSLIELSIAISIIAIIIIGYMSAGIILTKSRVAGAKSMTDSSVVNSTEGVGLWLETTSDKSFSNNATLDTNAAIKNWSDNSGRNNAATQNNSSNAPVYISEGINRIPAVSFNGTNSVINADASFLNSSDYTIFVVEKRTSNKSDNYFIGDSSVTGTNNNILLGYSADGSVIHSQGGSNSYSSTVQTYSSNGNAPRIFAFTSDANGKKTFINGVLAASSTDTSQLSNISTLAIGKGYQGQLGEVIMMANSLSDSARQNIEKYLAQKWVINSFSGSNIDCTGGKVTSSGCQALSCPVSIAGISATSVAAGSGSLTCDLPNYTGTVSYNCTNGALNPSGSCTCSGGSCLATCTFGGTVGIANGTAVGYTNSANISCNSGYSGGPINYKCLTTGAPVILGGSCTPIQCTFSGTAGVADGTVVNYTNSGSRNCDDGYSGSVTYQCLTSGAPTSVVSTCSSTIQCTFNGVVGITDGTVVGYTASSTKSCNAAGYTGSATYSCLSSGAPNVISGCTPVQCTFSGTSGIANGTVVNYTTSGSRACDTGYSGGPIAYQCLTTGAPTSISGACNQIQCTFSGTSGIANGTVVNYTTSGSRACDTGYSGGPIAYQCLTAGAPTSISGTCSPVQCTFSGVAGVVNGTKVNYTLSSASQACNAAGYSGSVSYTCNASGVLSVTGSCGANHWVLENSGICYLVNIGSSSNGRMTCSSATNNMVIYVTSGESAPTADSWKIYGSFYYGTNGGPAPMYCIWGQTKCSDSTTNVVGTCTGNWGIKSYRCVYP